MHPIPAPLRRPTIPGPRRFARVLPALLVLGFLHGCNILIPASYIVDGTGTVDAEHELDQVKTLVFVDDTTNILPRQVLKVRLAESVSSALVGYGLIPSFVKPGDAMAMVRSRDRSGDFMSMESIAREAGVTQLVFIEVDVFESSVRNAQLRPNAACSIRVMHFEKGGRVYPADLSNVGSQVGDRVVEVQLREVAPENARSSSDRRRVEQELVVKLSTAIVKLFRDYERLELGENLGVR